MSEYGSGLFGAGVYGAALPEPTTLYDTPALAQFTTVQDILAADIATLHYVVFIDGVLTETTAFDAQFDVNAAMATATLELDLPRADHVTANAPVLVQAGWNNYIQTVFSGRIPRWSGAISADDAALTVTAVGWSSLLAWQERYDLEYQGPISLRDLFLSLCQRRGVPSYQADDVTAPDGVTTIMLGGNPQIDDGKIIIPASTDPLRFLNQCAEPFGYRVYDTPAGTVRLSRISGLPVDAPAVTFTEGADLEYIEGEYNTEGIINYWDVRGPSYEDAYGAVIPIRSIAATVPYDPILAPEGYRYKRDDNNLLVTQSLADIVRNVREIDYSAPQTPVRWEAIALPGLQPGDVVGITSATTETTGTYWLTSLDLGITGDDFTATYGGWAGAGVPLKHGRDKQVYTLQTTPLHLGDEVVPWYAQPSPQGREKSWTFTIPERATAVNVRFWHHSTNSQLIDGAAADDLSVSKYELWRPGADKAESSGNIPPHPENYNLRLPYGSGYTHWTQSAVNLRGTDAGTITLKLMAGENAGFDDFEVRDVTVEVYGAAEPTFAREVL